MIHDSVRKSTIFRPFGSWLEPSADLQCFKIVFRNQRFSQQFESVLTRLRTDSGPRTCSKINDFHTIRTRVCVVYKSAVEQNANSAVCSASVSSNTVPLERAHPTLSFTAERRASSMKYHEISTIRRMTLLSTEEPAPSARVLHFADGRLQTTLIRLAHFSDIHESVDLHRASTLLNVAVQRRMSVLQALRK